MAIVKLKRGTFQHVESELYGYHETRKEIARIKNEILFGRVSDDENVGGGRSSRTSDPTGQTATLLASHKRLEQLTNIADAIEYVYDRLPEDKRKLIEVRYWRRPQTLNWEGIAKECNVSRITAMRWRDSIVQAIAIKAGWR